MSIFEKAFLCATIWEKDLLGDQIIQVEGIQNKPGVFRNIHYHQHLRGSQRDSPKRTQMLHGSKAEKGLIPPPRPHTKKTAVPNQNPDQTPKHQ